MLGGKGVGLLLWWWVVVWFGLVFSKIGFSSGILLPLSLPGGMTRMRITVKNRPFLEVLRMLVPFQASTQQPGCARAGVKRHVRCAVRGERH